MNEASQARRAARAPAFKSVPAGQIAIKNAFYQERPHLALSVDGLKASLSFQGSQSQMEERDDVVLGLMMDDTPGWISIERPMFSTLLRRFDEALASRSPSPSHAGLALEALFAQNLDALERIFGRPILLTSVVPEIPDDDVVVLDFRITIDSLGFAQGCLGLPAFHARLLASSLTSASAARRGEAELRFPVALCLAATSLSVNELAALQLGDVILVEKICDSPARPVAVVANHLAYPAALATRGFKIDGAAVRARGSALEWCMEQQSEPAKQALTSDKTDLGDLPVKVTFEIGRTEMTLAEIQGLGSGSLLPLGKPVDQAVDIMANGRKIGRGSIVSIGDSIGVEVTRLFSGR